MKDNILQIYEFFSFFVVAVNECMFRTCKSSPSDWVLIQIQLNTDCSKACNIHFACCQMKQQKIILKTYNLLPSSMAGSVSYSFTAIIIQLNEIYIYIHCLSYKARYLSTCINHAIILLTICYYVFYRYCILILNYNK